MPPGLDTLLVTSLGATVTNVKTSSGLLYFSVCDTTSVKGWLQLFDALAADVTLGTTVPKLSLPQSDGDAVPALNNPFFPPRPINFKTAISAAFTTTATGATAVAGGLANFGFL